MAEDGALGLVSDDRGNDKRSRPCYLEQLPGRADRVFPIEKVPGDQDGCEKVHRPVERPARFRRKEGADGGEASVDHQQA